MKTKIKFVMARDILQVGSERNKWAYAARELRTAQTALLRREHRRCLGDLEGSSHLYGWVTDSGRPLGIGYCAKSAGRKGERVCRIDLPIPISGVQLQEQAEAHLLLTAKPKRKKPKLRVVRAAAA